MNGFNKLEPDWKGPWCSRQNGNSLIQQANRTWLVTVPPNCGTAKFVGSTESMVLDLSQMKFGIPIDDLIVVLNGTAYYTNMLTDGRLEEV